MANKVGNVRGQPSRAKLLDAGIKAIHANGYSATGIGVITSTAKVPRGSFYNHFGDKETFGAKVIDLYFERHLETLKRIVAQNGAPPLVRLRDYFDERTIFFASLSNRKGCMMGNLGLETADHSDLMRAQLAEHFAIWSGFFAQCLEQAREVGDLPADSDAAALGNFLLNSWEGALLRMKVERSIKPLETFKTFVFDTLLRTSPATQEISSPRGKSVKRLTPQSGARGKSAR